MGVANTTLEQETPDVNVGAERAKPYGLECSPEGGFALSARGFRPVAVLPREGQSVGRQGATHLIRSILGRLLDRIALQNSLIPQPK